MPNQKQSARKARITGPLTDYVEAAMRNAKYEILEDDGSFWGEIPEVQGVWANEETLEDCRDELLSVLEDWILFSLVNDFEIPLIDGFNLTVAKASYCRASARSAAGTLLGL
jgi:predicted RNase H-like HicB family nuclease